MIFKYEIYHNERGVSLFELALVLPFLLLLIFGALEIAMKINLMQLIAAATQEGVKVASSYKPAPPRTVSCPNLGFATTVSKVCNKGAVEKISGDASLSTVARVSSCNYLKQQDLDASNWLVTTTIKFKQFDGKKFPIIELSMTERKPSCIFCAEKVISVIPSDSSAEMSLPGCQVI